MNRLQALGLGTLVCFMWMGELSGLLLPQVDKLIRSRRSLCCLNSDDPFHASTETDEDVTLGTYFFGKDDEFRRDAARVGLDPGRFIAFNSLALVLALGANFLGVTEGLLSIAPQPLISASRRLGIDQIYAVKGFKRYVSEDGRYEFKYPSTWLQDQAVVMKKVKTAELPQTLRKKVEAEQRAGPDAAFGPMAGDGRVNLSVVKTRWVRMMVNSILVITYHH